MAPLARRERRRVAVAERHDAEPVAAARGDVAESERDSIRDVGLAPVGRPEVHRWRVVESLPDYYPMK